MKAKLIVAGSMLFMFGCLLGSTAVYLWSSGNRWGAGLAGALCPGLLFVGFFFVASEDPV